MEQSLRSPSGAFSVTPTIAGSKVDGQTHSIQSRAQRQPRSTRWHGASRRPTQSIVSTPIAREARTLRRDVFPKLTSPRISVPPRATACQQCHQKIGKNQANEALGSESLESRVSLSNRPQPEFSKQVTPTYLLSSQSQIPTCQPPIRPWHSPGTPVPCMP